MNISIFGLGYVGCISLGCLAQNGHNVIGVDLSSDKVNQINSGKATIIEKDIDRIIEDQFRLGNVRATHDHAEAVAGTELSIICVGTPPSINGHLDLTQVFSVVNQIGKALKTKNSYHMIAVRSTVLPGTAGQIIGKIEQISGKKRSEHFAVLSNPEFLREGTAVYDYHNPPFTLIGSDNEQAARLLGEEVYGHLKAEIIYTEPKVAEIIKYINNTFHALKISFANEVGNICECIGIDSHIVMNIFCQDHHLNISPNYFKPGFAYGGSCLPKDLKALRTIAHDNYVPAPIIEAIEHSNDLQIKKSVDLITNTHKQNIGFLGLSFKEGTDDLRQSPAVTVIEAIIGKGYQVRIYDKNVQLSRLMGTNKVYIEEHVPHIAQLLENNVADLFEKSDVLVLTTREKEFADLLLDVTDKIIIDLVRIDDRFLGRPNYFGICW